MILFITLQIDWAWHDAAISLVKKASKKDNDILTENVLRYLVL